MGQNLYKSKRKERKKIFKRIMKVNLMLKNGSDRHNIKSKIYCNTIIFIFLKSNLLNYFFGLLGRKNGNLFH